MTDFEVITYEPLADRQHPRAIAKERIKKQRKQKVDEHPLVNQHASDEGAPDPRLEVDQILKDSQRLTDEERLENESK